MKILNIIHTSIFQVLSFSFVLIYFLGILNIHFSDKNDYCLMTYMYEYPQYVKISFPENDVYPQYGLHAYSEGRFTERARKMWFDGVPVLFIPGNSGSHMQARSIASVALRKALSHEYSYHFDFFAISYNEELSGLHGGVLKKQTLFAVECIKKILTLYRSNKYTKSVPTSVIVIGHSMGGLIAKRLLAYPSTLNTTNIAISLAAPLERPVLNFDVAMNFFYTNMDMEWDQYLRTNEDYKEKKILLSFGNGPRDVLMPSGLTSSNDSYINAMTTAIPGVWVSPDHVSIVWCKQLVKTLVRFLFDIIDSKTEQVTETRQVLLSKASQYFQANRSMVLSAGISRPNATMIADAFWYEDNRRIYQIQRPEINKTTYLMIRLVNFPQNRFVAIETVNVDDNDWIFGCNAMQVYNTHRYCDRAASLTELSRWTGAATGFGKRKLATIHLHSIKSMYPDWSHVVVKVSPTRKPIVLNVDINDHASRQITVNLPTLFFGKTIIKQETEPDSLYYELLIPGFNTLHQAYLLYVEPTAECKAAQYHVSAELHVPWAKNNEYYHYFTQLKTSPMKLRLYKTNPNVNYGGDDKEHTKITLLLDPQCKFTISITTSWYHRLAQFARNYSPAIPPYIAAIVLLAARSNILKLRTQGCASIHSALMSEGVKPYYVLVISRFLTVVLTTIPFLTFLFENATWKDVEVQYFTRSFLVLPVYMIALGLLHITAAAIVVVMLFSSQLAHRLLFRIIWRGGTGLAERVTSGLEKVPMVVSVGLVFAAPVSCGAASLVAGGAFYAFKLSKMYEEYLEDYVYKLMAKLGAKMCRLFVSKNANRNTDGSETALVPKDIATTANETVQDNIKAIETSDENNARSEESLVIKKVDNIDITVTNNENEVTDKEQASNNVNAVVLKSDRPSPLDTEKPCESEKSKLRKDDDEDDDHLSNLNFHMMMFLMWVTVTCANVPPLLTWARNFKYKMTLEPDTSCHSGLVMAICSNFVWQLNKPRKNLRYYEAVATLLFIVAVCLIIFGPSYLCLVNYATTYMFAVIVLQQILDQELPSNQKETVGQNDNKPSDATNGDVLSDSDAARSETKTSNDEEESSGQTPNNSSNDNNDLNNDSNNDCACDENKIYNTFKNLKEKFSFNEE